MRDGDVLILSGGDVVELLRGGEADVMRTVRQAYETHHREGHSVLPHSTFLKLPGGTERIIALPAYLGGAFNVAGVKWISSFPRNHLRGLPRASGVVVMSSAETGRPITICEGSIVSAKRTAASAALAASHLHPGAPSRVGLIGCGEINFETLRFLRHVWPAIAQVAVTDVSADRARRFVERCAATFRDLEVRAGADASAILSTASLVSIATTAVRPHIDDLEDCAATTVLHVSLRDIDPRAIVACDNVVDDVDHVCRADTSLHLAEQMLGHRRFIRCTIGDLIAGGRAPERRGAISVFSPFGLGILDLAVTKLAWERATACGAGVRLAAFSCPAGS